jgi:hypothetical protein
MISKLKQEEQFRIYRDSLNKNTISVDTPLIQNRTLMYLSRIIRLEDEQLYQQLKKLKPIAFGVNDVYFSNDVYCSLYILVAANYDLTEVKKSNLFKTDYIFDEITTSKLRIIVFKSSWFDYLHSYCMFMESRYSQMFTIEQLAIMYPTKQDKRSFAYQVLADSELSRKRQLKTIHKIFRDEKDNLDILTIDDVKESDFPVHLPSEIFNFVD